MTVQADGETWPKTTVENLAEYITVGFVGSMSSLFVDEGVPLLRGQNIHPYSLDLSNLKYISQETHRKWKKSALKAGDVVIVRVGYPGTACVIPEGIGDLNAASLVIVRPNPALLDSKFLSYVINSPWGKAQVAGRLVGAAQQVFNTQTAAELEIPAPPLPVQRRIVDILSAYDELMENNQRRIRVLEEMARTLYREWFVTAPETRNWSDATIGEFVTLKRGYDLPERVRRQGSVPVVSSAGVTGCHNESMACGPGLVTGRYGTLGEVHLVWEDFWPLNTSLYVSNFHETPLLYAYWLLKQVLRQQTGSAAAVPGVNRNHLHQLVVPAPPRETQRSFHLAVEPMAKQALILQRQIQNLRRTRDLLLPRLLSGQIGVA